MHVQVNETHRPPSSAVDVAVVLGRSPELSRLELEATLERAGIAAIDCTLAGDIALVKASRLPEKSWFFSLGGARKFGVVRDRIARPSVDLVVPALESLAEGRRVIGISSFSSTLPAHVLGKAVKRQSATIRRFVAPTQGSLLSDAQSKGLQKDLEVLIVEVERSIVVVEILATQDIDAFTARDRHLPVADPRRGMLPTKLARMMVNIGLGLTPEIAPVLYDPCCGTGRIVLEGVLVGARVLASDRDAAAVSATQENLRWLGERYSVNVDTSRVFVADVTTNSLPSSLTPASIDVIVTEPYLGPPQRRAPTAEQAEAIFIELMPLYQSLFARGSVLLTRYGGLVAVFPTIGRDSLLPRLVDSLRVNGYDLVDSVRVARPDSFIGREIAVCKRQGS